MLPFPIDRREGAFVVVVFVVVMIGFGVLSSAIHWPNEREGWPLAVAVAALVALSRLIPRAISLLQQSGVDSLTLPGGFKFDFSAAAEIATVNRAFW